MNTKEFLEAVEDDMVIRRIRREGAEKGALGWVPGAIDLSSILGAPGRYGDRTTAAPTRT
jgi:hypothetical protein